MDWVDASLLFDVYDELLTDHQREVWRLYYLEDWSLAEISEAKRISRSAVHDLLERTERVLGEYEEKLRLLAALRRRREGVHRLMAALAQAPARGQWYEEAMRIAQWLAEEEGAADV
ncbi:MAG: sigma factor-like helix-turn-helix DNA-binding protein [Thermaerobacter sp.]|nr:sigma factor-like helix-turn-helix DNA-binding protein [Thermaerobacter sp.]